MGRVSLKAKSWLVVGWMVLLSVLFLHPLILAAFGIEHPDNCLLCAAFSNGGIFLPAVMTISALFFFGYFVTRSSQKLASRYFFVSSGRAPPAAS